ncbi:glycosyltransferase family 4 protein [Methylophaga sp.]|uniref:glycosyltransferase family 4 protein n=1 Tax=Methylophaga sp. TaxID=2024840 RepID=UPI003F7239A1
MPKIGYLALDNPYDVKSFSGTGFYMFNALNGNRDFEVHLLGEAILTRKTISCLLIRAVKRIFKFSPFIHEKLKNLELKFFVRQVNTELKKTSIDFIIAPVCSSLVAKIATNPSLPPIIFVTDATPSFLEEFYNWPIKPEAYVQEKIAIEAATAVVYSSKFMANRAKLEYSTKNSDENKFKVVPFGLNLEGIPEFIPDKNVSGKINLLFVGRDWKRKGGDLVIAIFKLLKSKGHAVKLTIIGNNPEEAQLLEDIVIIPYIDKSVPEQKKKYFDILSEAHFLILPTRADCTPMVIAEANAFGTPVITTNVGGIPTLVEEGKNGFLLDINSTEEKYVELIMQTFNDPKLFKDLCMTSRIRFDTCLNWDAWSSEISNICKKIVIYK